MALKALRHIMSGEGVRGQGQQGASLPRDTLHVVAVHILTLSLAAGPSRNTAVSNRHDELERTATPSFSNRIWDNIQMGSVSFGISLAEFWKCLTVNSFLNALFIKLIFLTADMCDLAALIIV